MNSVRISLATAPSSVGRLRDLLVDLAESLARRGLLLDSEWTIVDRSGRLELHGHTPGPLALSTVSWGPAADAVWRELDAHPSLELAVDRSGEVTHRHDLDGVGPLLLDGSTGHSHPGVRSLEDGLELPVYLLELDERISEQLVFWLRARNRLESLELGCRSLELNAYLELSHPRSCHVQEGLELAASIEAAVGTRCFVDLLRACSDDPASDALCAACQGEGDRPGERRYWVCEACRLAWGSPRNRDAEEWARFGDHDLVLPDQPCCIEWSLAQSRCELWRPAWWSATQRHERP